MKTLTVRQPSAWAIVNGYKDVENRSWATLYRGPLLIHAAARPGTLAEFADNCDLLEDAFGLSLPEEFHVGGIVGIARLTDCNRTSASEWYDGVGYAWTLSNARPLPYTAVRGKLGLWTVSLKDFPHLATAVKEWK